MPEYDLTATIGVLVDGEIQPASDSWIVEAPEAPARANVPEDPSADVQTDPDGALLLTREGTPFLYEPEDIRLLAGPPDEAALPLAITRSIADASDLKVGSVIEVNVFGATVPAEVAAVGVVVPWVLLRAVDLRGLTGASQQPALAVDPWLLGPVIAGVLLVVGLAVITSATLASRADLAQHVRLGEER